MRFATVAFNLIAWTNVSLAFSPLLQRNALIQRTPTQIFSSQWEEEEEEVATRTSFTDAEETLKKEEDDKKINDAGDIDANPQVCVGNLRCRLK